jgi:hypothetical protein
VFYQSTQIVIYFITPRDVIDLKWKIFFEGNKKPAEAGLIGFA